MDTFFILPFQFLSSFEFRVFLKAEDTLECLNDYLKLAFAGYSSSSISYSFNILLVLFSLSLAVHFDLSSSLTPVC